MKPLVIYHAHCTDGFGAAFAAWMALGDEAEYRACAYGEPAHKTLDGFISYYGALGGRTVYILDFSFPREVMEWLFQTAARVVWLDHHKTAFEMYDILPSPHARFFATHIGVDARHTVELNNAESGAMLAWEYFHPDVEAPKLIQRIDDRDRWVFQYDDSRALHAGLATLKPWTFDGWRVLLIGHMYERVVNDGQAILGAYNDQIRDRVRVAEKCHIVPATLDSVESYKAPWTWDANDQLGAAGLAVNSPIHQSEIGNELAKASGTYGLVWYYDAATRRANVSLRSIGDYDVSAIAKALGGGGHKNAAGFNVDMGVLLEWLA